MLGIKMLDKNILKSRINSMPQGGKRMPFFFGFVAGNFGKLRSNSILPCDNLLLSGCIRENPDTFLSSGVFVFEGNFA